MINFLVHLVAAAAGTYIGIAMGLRAPTWWRPRPEKKHSRERQQELDALAQRALDTLEKLKREKKI